MGTRCRISLDRSASEHVIIIANEYNTDTDIFLNIILWDLNKNLWKIRAVDTNVLKNVTKEFVSYLSSKVWINLFQGVN